MGTYLIINASPRSHANSKAIAERVKAQVEAAGHAARVVNFTEANIGYCVGCDGCQQKSELWCSRQDGFNDLLPEIDACDGMVFASPVYWGDITAQAKTVIDRLYAFIDFNSSTFSKATKTGKKLALVFTSRGMPAGTMDAAADRCATAFGVAGFQDHRTLLFGGTHPFGAVEADLAKLAQVDDLAAWLIS
jgi:multimeric flavodoxin WrbA